VASRRELDLEVCQIGEALWPCYFNRKPYTEWIEAYELAVAAARRIGDPAVEARLRSALAKALTETGEHACAQEELTTARRMAERSGNVWLQASVLDFQGHLDLDRRRYAAAQAAFESARDMHAEAGVTRGVVLGDFHVGRALAGRGAHREAIDAYEAAIAAIDRTHDAALLGRVQIALATASLELGDVDRSQAAATEALEIARSRALRYYEARALEVLAQLAFDRGEFDAAARRWQEAYAFYHDLASPRADELSARQRSITARTGPAAAKLPPGR
jgi:tetratricopeptide (TPR) repeat protein